MPVKKVDPACRCPHCRSTSTLTHYWTLFLSLDGWPTALLFTAVINAVGGHLQLDPHALVWFSLLAVIPLCFSIVRKCACDVCGIEFEREIGESVATAPVPSAKVSRPKPRGVIPDFHERP